MRVLYFLHISSPESVPELIGRSLNLYAERFKWVN